MLETLDADNANHCQVYIQLESDANCDFKIIPLEDFATGGGSTGGADPTFPATSFGAGTAVVNFNAFSTSGWFNCIADEGMCAIIASNDIDSTTRWIYCGEVTAFHSGAGDTRAYVIWDTPSDYGWNDFSGQERFNRLSPADNSTILVRGEALHVVNSSPISQVAQDSRRNLLGSDVVWPVGVHFEDVGHIHDAGWLRNVFAVNHQLGNEGTLGLTGSPDFYYINDNLGNTNGGIAFTWDGETRI